MRVYAEEEGGPRRVLLFEGTIIDLESEVEWRSIHIVGPKFHSALEVMVTKEAAVTEGHEKYEEYLEGNYQFRLRRSKRRDPVSIPYKNILRIEQKV